ncbi:unnamed protein product, partial [Rotaria magnacalcarata]
DHAVVALERLLHSYTFDHLIQGMTIDTIVQLVRLVLENQYCVLGKNLYRQRIGGASGSPLTIPLTYIYLFYWQQDSMNVFINKNELFGRYQDQAFITWNESEDELHTVLTFAHSEFPQYIWNTTGIGSTICFRDIEIGHNNGRVRTTVNYLDSYMRNNALPSFLDILQQRIGDVWTWLRASLLNAVRYCSDDVNFEDAKSQMKFILSLNGFSDDTFNDGLHEFLDQFGVSTVDPSLTRTNYEIMRQHVFDNDKYRKVRKKNSLLQRKEQVTLHLPYVSASETLVIAQFEHELNNLLSEHASGHSRMKDLKIKILPHRSPTFSMADLLVHKRPPIHRLTLPETDQINKSSLMENFSQASSIDNKALDDEMVEQSRVNRPIMMLPIMDRNVTPPDFNISNNCMSPLSIKIQPCAVQPSTLFDDNTHEKGEFSVNKTKAMNDKQEGEEEEEQQQQDNDDDDDEYEDIDDDDDEYEDIDDDDDDEYEDIDDDDDDEYEDID